jgi:hypothetical protein
VPSESDSVRLAGMLARSVTIFEQAASRGMESAKRWSPGSCGGNKQARNGACVWGVCCTGETFFRPAAIARIAAFASFAVAAIEGQKQQRDGNLFKDSIQQKSSVLSRAHMFMSFFYTPHEQS